MQFFVVIDKQKLEKFFYKLLKKKRYVVILYIDKLPQRAKPARYHIKAKRSVARPLPTQEQECRSAGRTTS